MNLCLDLLNFLRNNVVIEGKIPDPNANPEEIVQALTEDEQVVTPASGATVSAPESPVKELTPQEKHEQYRAAFQKEFNVDLGEYQDKLAGGLGDKKIPCDFPLEALLKGTKVELEHTKDPLQALEITMDHLTEKLDYYDELAKVEGPEGTNQVQKQNEEDALVTERSLKEMKKTYTMADAKEQARKGEFEFKYDAKIGLNQVRRKMPGGKWQDLSIEVTEDPVKEGCGGMSGDEKKWEAIQKNMTPAQKDKMHKKAAKTRKNEAKLEDLKVGDLVTNGEEDLTIFRIEGNEVWVKNFDKEIDGWYEASSLEKIKEGKIPDGKEDATGVVGALIETFVDGQKVTVKNEGLKSGFEYAGQAGIIEDVPSAGNYIGVRMESDKRLRYFFPEDLVTESDVASDLEPNDKEKEDLEASKEDAERRREVEQQSGVGESRVNEDIQITAEELLQAVNAPENARMRKMVTDRANMLKQEGTLSRDRAIGIFTNLVQPIAHILYINKNEGLAEGNLPYDAVVAQVATILADEVLGQTVKESEEKEKKPEDVTKGDQPTGEDDKNKTDNAKTDTEKTPDGTSLDTKTKKLEVAPELKGSGELTDQEKEALKLNHETEKKEKEEKTEPKKEE